MASVGGRGVSSIARMRVAENLRALLELRDISLHGLADRSGMSRRYAQTVLRGERNVGIDRLDVLARTLGVRTWRLLAPVRVAHDIPREQQHERARLLLSRCIRTRTAHLGLTITDVVALTGCARGHFNDVVACRACDGVDGLPRLADVLRLELHDLLVPVAKM